jgi:RNA polymerase sigma-70 factor, ECF subfamily
MGMDDIIEQLWAEMYTDLRNFICRRAPNCDDADDIVQDVFLKVHRSLGTVRDMKALQSWVYQIARNSLVDFYRARRPVTELPDDLTLPPTEQDDPEDGDMAAYLISVVDSLSPAYRDAIRLTDLNGLSQVEAAGRMGISVPGAKSRVQRARRMVRDRLLTCCHVEFDRRGGVIETRPHCCCCCE